MEMVWFLFRTSVHNHVLGYWCRGFAARRCQGRAQPYPHENLNCSNHGSGLQSLHLRAFVQPHHHIMSSSPNFEISPTDTEEPEFLHAPWDAPNFPQSKNDNLVFRPLPPFYSCRFSVLTLSKVPTPSWFEMAQALEDVKPVEVSYEGESSDESEIEPTATSTRPSTPAGDN